jgi:hypothetical protein
MTHDKDVSHPKGHYSKDRGSERRPVAHVVDYSTRCMNQLRLVNKGDKGLVNIQALKVPRLVRHSILEWIMETQLTAMHRDKEEHENIAHDKYGGGEVLAIIVAKEDG